NTIKARKLACGDTISVIFTPSLKMQKFSIAATGSMFPPFPIDIRKWLPKLDEAGRQPGSSEAAHRRLHWPLGRSLGHTPVPPRPKPRRHHFMADVSHCGTGF